MSRQVGGEGIEERVVGGFKFAATTLARRALDFGGLNSELGTTD
jgi:hypothetical protein